MTNSPIREACAGTPPPIRPLSTVQEAQLRGFIASGAITQMWVRPTRRPLQVAQTPQARAEAYQRTYELQVMVGPTVFTLCNARGVVRSFASLNTLVGLLQGMGACALTVDLSHEIEIDAQGGRRLVKLGGGEASSVAA